MFVEERKVSVCWHFCKEGRERLCFSGGLCVECGGFRSWFWIGCGRDVLLGFLFYIWERTIVSGKRDRGRERDERVQKYSVVISSVAAAVRVSLSRVEWMLWSAVASKQTVRGRKKKEK